MRATTPPQSFELPDEFRSDSFLAWLRDHADEDLWMPRIPIAVTERIRKHFPGQKRATLERVWVGIRKLLLARSAYGGNALSVRDIADESGVSRSRLCGDSGYIQDLLNVGLIGVTVTDEEASLKDRYKGRTLYHIDMRALEAESLILLRARFSATRKDLVPRRNRDPRQRDLLTMLSDDPQGAPATTMAPDETREALHSRAASGLSGTQLAPFETTLAPSGATMVSSETVNMGQAQHNVVAAGATMVSLGTMVVPSGANNDSHATGMAPIGTILDPSSAPRATTMAPLVPVVVPHAAVGMDGIGMDGKGGEGEKRPLSQRETLQIVYTAIQEALAPAIQQALAALSDTQQIGVPLPPRGPAAPQGEPPIGRGPLELWTLYRRGEPDPLELDRLALLPSQFDEPSGGHGAYWVARAILMLTEAERPITVPYLRGVLERMRRAGEWSTTQLEAPPEEHERGRAAVAAVLPPPPRVVAPTPPVPPAVSGERTALTIFRQYAGGTKLLSEQERQIAERVRDLDIWEVVCSNWRENGWKFDSVDKMIHRYVTLESEVAKERPTVSDGLTKLEREIHAIPGLSDEEKERFCTEMLQYPVEDRKRFVEDLRQCSTAHGGEGVPS